MTSGTRAPHQAAVLERVPSQEIGISAAGARLVVRSGDASLLALVGRCLPPGAVVRAVERPHVVYDVDRETPRQGDLASHVVSIRDVPTGGRAVTVRARGADELAALLASDLEFRMALHAPARVFIHAASVAWHGRVIALPGRTFAGKSTLAAALLRAGAEYLSDEFAVLGADGLVYPFARPLHLRAVDGSSMRLVSVTELGPVRVAPASLALVARTRFRRGARWRARPMSRGETMLTLVGHAVAARLRPAAVLEHVARAVQRGNTIGVRGPRGDADEAAAWLLDRARHLPLAP